jgi:hypothetical protein
VVVAAAVELHSGLMARVLVLRMVAQAALGTGKPVGSVLILLARLRLDTVALTLAEVAVLQTHLIKRHQQVARILITAAQEVEVEATLQTKPETEEVAITEVAAALAIQPQVQMAAPVHRCMAATVAQ